MNVDDLKRWAERCDREGRTAQAILVRNIAFEIEEGMPWLEFISDCPIDIPTDKEPS
jgi:hypothetical protein